MSFPDDQNPYAATPSAPLSSVSVTGGPYGHSIISLDRVFSRSWELLQRYPSECITGTGIFLGLSLLMSVPNFAFVVLAILNRENPEFVAQFTLINFAVNGVNFVLHNFLYAGLIVYFLKIARGVTPQIGDLFSAGHSFFPILACPCCSLR